MPRILIVCEYPTLLGGERSMLSTLPHVAAAGFDALVAAPPAGPLAAELARQGVAHEPWTMRDGTGRRLTLPQARAELAALIRRCQPSLVHANSLSMARVVGPVAAECRIPGIGHLRDIARVSRQGIHDINQLALIIAVSRATLDYHATQGLATDLATVLHNGVDLEEFRPRRPTGYVHRELGLEADALLVATIGQLGLRKATDHAIEVVEGVVSNLPRVQLLLVGERTSDKSESREFEARLHRLAEQPHLRGRVHFLGARPDVPALMNECALLLHTARQEPLGRVLLEGAASGLPVVATNVGGTSEIFRGMEDGALLAPEGDIESLTRHAIALLADRELRYKLGTGARHRAEATFDVKAAAGRLIELYGRVL